mgnify:CR=1 FL=1
MERQSIFFDEWIKSLREQYKYVIRNNDTVTLPSLTDVMHDVGFTDDELAQLRVQATMHVDDVADDFVPDLNVLKTVEAGQPHPAECTCPQCIPIDESQYDDEGQPLDIDPEQAAHETGHQFVITKPESEVVDNIISDDDIDAESTFEDSLVEELEDVEDNIIEDEPEEDDPDAPKQMSMF